MRIATFFYSFLIEGKARAKAMKKPAAKRTVDDDDSDLVRKDELLCTGLNIEYFFKLFLRFSTRCGLFRSWEYLAIG